jgi:hypothetical protein
MNWKKSEVLAVILIGGLLAAKALQKEKGHECKWPLCPYKEVVKKDWDSAVTKYTGERGTDAWCIDMLHLEFPNDEYEQLEEKLFKH